MQYPLPGRFSPLFAVLVFVSLSLFQGCNSKVADIQNSPSEAHQYFRNSQWGIIPPAGFTIRGVLGGFDRKDDKGRMVLLKLKPPVSEVIEAFKKGDPYPFMEVEIKEYRDVTVNGMAGLIYYSTEESTTDTPESVSMVWGNDTAAFMIRGPYAKGELKIREDIEKALESIVFNPGYQEDPMTTVPMGFHSEIPVEVGMASSELFFGGIPNEEGKENEKKAAVTVISFDPSAEGLSLRELFMEGITHINKAEQFELDSLEAVEIDGMPGMQGIAILNATGGGRVWGLHTVLKGRKGNAYHIVINAPEEDRARPDLYRKITSGFFVR